MTEEENYLQENVIVGMRRVELLAVLGSCILALRHPTNVGIAAEVVRNVCRQFCPLVDRYVPAEVLAEWEQVLWPEGKEGVEW